MVELRGPRWLSHATATFLGNREEARDAVSGAWIDILSWLAKLRETRWFPGWATRIGPTKIVPGPDQMGKNIRRKLGQELGCGK